MQHPPSALLGVVWAVVTLVMLFAGPSLTAAWFAGVAALAGLQAARTWKRDPSKHPLPVAVAAGAGLGVFAAAFGVVPFAVAALVGLAAAAGWASSAGANVTLTLACAAVPIMAAAPPVLLRSTDGIVAPLVLLTFAAVYDAAASVMGAGARWRWEGPAAGIACIASVTLTVAAVFPQFKGLSPWELGVLAGVLTPMGRVVAARV
ncbi:MAG: hypothetical protein ACYDH6_01980, partial [Acidimicrobiales bacterium]